MTADQVSNFEDLFLNHMDELRQRITGPPDRERLLMSAIFLRKLLMDGRSLLDIVNRKHRLRIRFRLPILIQFKEVVSAFPGGPVVYAPPQDVAPISYEASLSQFLSHVIFTHNGRDCTVQDLVQYNAYVNGGIHHDGPDKGQPYATFKGFFNVITIDIRGTRMDAEVGLMENVARVTLYGLMPLEEAVLRSRQSVQS